MTLLGLPMLGPIALAACLPLTAHAQRADLPPEAQVIAILDNHPMVSAAAAHVLAARAQSDMLRRGQHEVTVTGGYIRRSVDREGSFNEVDVTIGRAFRLPGKAALDRQAGALGIEVAQNRAEDVRHQTALVLSALWYDWLTAGAHYRNELETVAVLDRAAAAVRRRRQLQDAADLEIDQAQSTLAQARGQAASALSMQAEARAILAATFPDLALPAEPPALGSPELPAQPLAAMRDLVIERSHEIRAADREAQRLDVVSRRVRADRLSDPTFGVRMFSERGGTERGLGLVASVPLGGGYRRAAADQAGAEANAAGFDLANVRRQVEATADADLSNARTRFEVWRGMADAGSSTVAAAARTERGHVLGAIDLADMLYARRLAHDAQRAEIDARSAAVRALTKLQIDSHSIWVTPGDD
jgi:outer membrane protein TolC